MRMTSEFPGWYTTALKTLQARRRRRSRSTGRSTARSRGPTRRCAAPARSTSAAPRSEFLRAVKQAHDGPAEQPFLLLGQQSVADPTRAPAGKHTAWAYTHGPQDAPWTDGIVERMEAQVERFAPGFRDASSPATCSDPAGWRPATRT